MTMRRHPLPDGWRWTTLAEVGRWSSGGTPKSNIDKYYEGEHPWAVIGDLTDGPVATTERTITAEGLAESSAKLVPPGTLLVAMYGSIGKLGISQTQTATNQAIACCRPVADVEVKWLFFWLLACRDALTAAGKGGTQRNISQTVLKSWPVPVPPLAAQHAIVETIERMLSHLDAASQGLGRLRTKQQQLERGLYARFYRDASVAAGQVQVGALLDGIEAGKSFKCPGHVAAPGKLGVLKLGAVTWGVYDESENKELPAGTQPDARWEVKSGDLLIGRANTAELVGATALVGATRPGLYLSDKTLRLVPRPGVPAGWIKAALAAPQSRTVMSAVATGTSDSMRNLSQSKIKSVAVPAVPADAAQRLDALEAELVRARRLSGSIAEALVHARTIRRSILKAAFEGRLTGITTAAWGADLQEDVA